MKRLVVLAGMAAVLLSVAACNGPAPGPTTNNTGGQPSSDGPSGSTSPSASGSGSLPYNHPCSLLSSSDLQQLGASTPPSRDDVVTSHGCSFNTSNATIDVGIRVNVGLAGFQANGGTVTSTTIGSHQAKQNEETSGACTIALGVSASSRVDVTVDMLSGGDACPTATKVAEVVEPKLPAAG